MPPPCRSARAQEQGLDLIATLVLDAVDEGRQRQLARAANVIMDKLVREMPLHRFHPDDVRFSGVQFVPTRIATTPTSLIVTPYTCRRNCFGVMPAWRLKARLK